MREPSNQKADKGTITHKALEILARKKLALQQEGEAFTDGETGRVFRTAEVDAELAIEHAWNHYTTKFDHHTWKVRDFEDCRGWMYDAMSLWGGLFNPLQRNVLSPEQYFDFTIDAPWAAYRYVLPDGKVLEGQLGLKGTIDLVCATGDDGVIELVDWKTGLRKDWATGKPKDWASLRKDPQLRIYHYALSRVYPWTKEIIITIVFIRDGGPFSLPFSREDLPETEAMLRKRFETIRDSTRPRRIWGDWKCKRLCHYGKTKQEGTGVTICETMNQQLIDLGMERATAKHADFGVTLHYGEGGGRSER
jgi:hypothetical protein